MNRATATSHAAAATTVVYQRRWRLKGRLRVDWYQVPFTEALLWITALKDFHGTGIDYTTTAGQTLRALGWARNYAAHELLTLSTVDLTSSGMVGVGMVGRMMPGSPGTLVWVPESTLPAGKHEPDSRRPVKSGACRWQGHLGTIANSNDVPDEPSLAQIQR